MKLFLVLILILVSSCQFSPLTPGLSPDASRDDQIKTLNQILTNPLNASDRQALKETCSINKKLLFCPALTSDVSLITLSKKYLEPPVVSGIRKTEPSEIHWNKKGTIDNAKIVKKEPTANIVKGLKGASLEQLKKAASQSLKISCPNRLSAATGALLEDFLEKGATKKLISQLYQKSATCKMLPTPERENFYVRSGLLQVWDKDWKSATHTFRKATQVPNASGRAFYWYVEGLKKTKQNKKAEKLIAQLPKTHPFSFHRLLLAPPSLTNKDEVTGVLPSVENLQIFLDGLRGLREQSFEKAQFIWAEYALNKLTGLNREKQVLLFDYASPSTQIERSQYFLTGDRTESKLLKMFYPTPLKDIFTKYFSENISLGYAFARQESRFFPYALSSANAMGLFQIIKDTAEKLKSGSSQDLFSEKENVEVASLYVQKLSKDWKGAYPLIIASYNAGEEKVAAWLEKYPKDNALLWIDLIPYRETRDYVAQVLSHYYWYEQLYSQKKVDLWQVVRVE